MSEPQPRRLGRSSGGSHELLMADSADTPTTTAQRVGMSVGWVIGGFSVLGAVAFNWDTISAGGPNNRDLLEIAIAAYVGYLFYLGVWALGIWFRWLSSGDLGEWRRFLAHPDLKTAYKIPIGFGVLAVVLALIKVFL